MSDSITLPIEGSVNDKVVLTRLFLAAIAIRDEDKTHVMGGWKIYVHGDTWTEFVKAIEDASRIV